jgi:ubiquinone/menaquinone biosynthesis C-methylase UbiE
MTFMNEFDLKAAEWDNNPMHWDRSRAIVEEIKNRIPLNKNMDALEFGAGTGIASFLLKDNLKEIILMDNSSEMVKIIKGKIETTKVENLKVLNFDLEHDDYTGQKFDLIFSQMVLHHVDDTDSIIGKFGKLLKRGGYLAIADLFPEDGSFHGEGFTGHKGFDPEKLSEILQKHQFKNIAYRPCFTIERKIPDAASKHFEVFLLSAARD